MAPDIAKPMEPHRKMRLLQNTTLVASARVVGARQRHALVLLSQE